MVKNPRFQVVDTEFELGELDKAIKTLGYKNRGDWYRDMKREVIKKASMATMADRVRMDYILGLSRITEQQLNELKHNPFVVEIDFVRRSDTRVDCDVYYVTVLQSGYLPNDSNAMTDKFMTYVERIEEE